MPGLKYLDKNYIPKKIGQYRFTAIKSLADIEWLLARCAGYGAGFDLYISPEQVKAHPLGKQILATIRQWMAAIGENAFNEEQKAFLRDVTQEVTLERTADGHWNLRKTGRWIPDAK